ncbi:MAG TPA: FmdE family protein [Anaerolineae bacterium]|nr:FmdE family protein [Anaerolineae bacterium]
MTIRPKESLEEILRACAALHARLCPRQVLGARMGLLAGRLLGMDVPRRDKRLLVIVEADGCAVDGIATAAGCSVGRRTLRVEDFGKVAATFVDVRTAQAVRIVPRGEARALARKHAPEARNRWEAQLIAYQRMPDERLLRWEWVRLTMPLKAIIGQPGTRAECEVCGEEIINGREVMRAGRMLCRTCAGQAYYQPTGLEDCSLAAMGQMSGLESLGVMRV